MSTSPFKREHIVKAFFDLDFSSSEPSIANKTSKPRDRKRPVVSKRPTNEAKENNKVTFLTLPVEIRLQIYDLLLVSRNSVTGEKRSLPMFKDPGDEPRLHPAILQTCKQVHHEANSIVWSQNTFHHAALVEHYSIHFLGKELLQLIWPKKIINRNQHPLSPILPSHPYFANGWISKRTPESGQINNTYVCM